MAEHLAAFAGAALLLAMVPGPSMAVVVRQTVRHGRRAAFAATIANELGLLLWAVGASFGLSALVAASQTAYLAVRTAGAILMIALGIQSLYAARRHTGNVDAVSNAVDTAPSDSFAWRAPVRVMASRRRARARRRRAPVQFSP